MKAVLVAISFLCVCPAHAGDAKAWDYKAAAGYLDQRMTWWESWPAAVRDHDTYCVSCHTSLTYAMARPALRGALAEHAPTATESQFVDNIAKRVALWDQLEPYYSDAKNGAGKSAESRGTEVVLNAVVLARYGGPAAADALREMWDLQLKAGEKRGSWTWMNFHNEPWEADDSAFWGAAMAGLAAGWAPAEYRKSAAIQENLAMLGAYLQREQASQSTLNRAVALWAAGNLPGLLKPEQRAAIIDEIAGKQHEDGGWSASSLTLQDWKRRDGTPLDARSDGYGTGLMVAALDQSGMASAKKAVAKGRIWLQLNQSASGGWLSTSMNKQRDPATDVGRFMDDAATAYSVIALTGR